MRIIKILAIGAIGFILGLGVWKVKESGYLEQWEKLSAPPQAVTELIPTGDPPFFIRTMDGSTYSYDSWHDKDWLPGTIPQHIDNPVEVKKPCNFLSPEFFPFSNAPRNINNCFQEQTMYADGYISYAVVLDNNGNIWEWEHSVTPDYITTMFCFPFLGLLVGLVTAFIWVNQNGSIDKTLITPPTTT
jgi:hypothetical protein